MQQQQIIHDLQENLDQMARDKMTLEAKIIEMSPYKNELIVLQGEITKLQVHWIHATACGWFLFRRVCFCHLQPNFHFVWKVNYDKALQERQHLITENESLRNRLRDVVNSPLSDAEKQQIIDDSQQRLHSSAPASIAIPNVSYLTHLTCTEIVTHTEYIV